MASPPTPVDAAVRRDASRASFEAACRDAWRPVLRLLLATLPPGADVEDATAATFETAWRRRDELAGKEEPVTWLLAVAVNVARNERRRLARRWRLIERLTHAGDVRRAGGDAADCALHWVGGPATEALLRLGVADRELLVLHAWNELEVPELAEVLGIRPNTAAQRLRRAKLRLQAELEGGEPS